ncbi:MAG: hypothetical protein AB1894_03305 [Chloroflexota bacterium]
MAALATVISSVLDHARTDFSNPWLWVPTAVGVFTTAVAVMAGATEPFLAPLLFADIGGIGLIALLDPVERRPAEE